MQPPMIGVLLVNLGTPDAPETGPVRRYLAEFLADARVLDIPALPRMLLLYGAILPTRPQKSARAYRQIWDGARGSPLLFHSLDLADGLRAALGPGFHVELAMRYGQPPLDGAVLDRFDAAGCDRVIVVPLYPHYASSSTGSTLERLFAIAGARMVPPALTVVRDFYVHPGFISAQAAIALRALQDFRANHVLMSFHGLPERQVVATDLSGGQHCLKAADCCAAIVPANRACYRAQCHATARALAAAMDLPDGGWSVSFQSRLGRVPWIKPYTDEVLVERAQAGTRRLAFGN